MQTSRPVVSGLQTFRPEDPVQLAVEAMNRLHVSYVLITQNQVLVGILTERDILRAAAAALDFRSTPIEPLMSQPVICCTEAEMQDRDRVIAILQQHQIRHLPVVMSNGQVCRVVTPENLLPNALVVPCLEQGAASQPTLEQLTQDLEASKLRYRNILNNLPDMVCCFLIDGRISFANRAHCQFFNQPLEAILGRDFFGHLPAEQATLRQQVKQLLQTRGSITYQQQILVESSSQASPVRWIEWTNCAICDDAGQVIEFESIGRDITLQQAALQERRRAETTLRASESRYRAIIEAMPDLLLRVQRDGTCLDCILPKNADPEQFIPVQQHLSEVLHPENLQVKLNAIEQALETGELQICEQSLIRQGDVFHEEIRAIACGTDEVLMIIRDVTRRRQNELQFQRLTENVPGVVYRYMLHPDGQEQFTYVSPCCRDLLEVEAEDLLADFERFWGLIHPTDQAQIRQHTDASAQNLQSWTLEFRILTPSGLLKWIRAFAQPERQINGMVIWDGLMVEITESKRANVALQASEAKLRSILENTPSVISLINRRGTTLFINRSLSGRSATTLIGCNLADYLTPEQPNQLDAALIAAFEQGESSQFDAIGIGRTQLTAHYEVYIAPVKNTRSIEAAIVIANDITVRKQAETVLRKREAQLLLALEAGKIVCWEYDLATQQFSCIGQHQAIDQWLPITWHLSETAYFELIHPDDRDRVQQALETALSDLRDFEDLHRLNVSDQSVWLLSKGKIFVDATGSRKRMVGVSINISERKRIEDSLVTQQAFLRSIINAVNSSIVVKDSNWRFLMANQAAADIYGIQIEELEGKTDLDFNPDIGQVEEFWHINQQVIDSMQPIVVPAQVIHNAQGESHWYRTTISPFAASTNQMPGVIVVASDITDLKQAEDALRQAKEAAEAANLAKSQFLANMSHELRTPLNSILGFAQLLNQETILSQDQRDHLGIILRSGEHLLELINDVLEMAKIDAGRITFNPTRFDLHQLLENIRSMMQIRATAKHLTLTLEHPLNIPHYIQTDEAKLRQVLLNLLGNAIKFTAVGQVILRVRAEWIAAAPAADSCLLYFTVEDTGPGIAASELDGLFSPFIQTEVGRQSHEGTGLGLAISRRFVELMGGSIEVKSTFGQGATFEFSLPVHTIHQPELASTSQVKPLSLRIQPSNFRILVVEDQITNRKLVVRLLTKLGFQVQEALNGQEAVVLWQRWSPHLILMDMRMPVMNGYEAARQIRQQERSNQLGEECPVQPTTIIALTANAFEEDRNQIFDAGCDDYLPKPFKVEQFLTTLVQHLGLYTQSSHSLGEAAGLSVSAPGWLQPPPPLTAHDLAELPHLWCAELYQAAVQLDAERCVELIQTVADPHLIDPLMHLVDEFRFDLLLELTQR